MTTTYNGSTNYETWNAKLWIGNDEFLYNTAKACVQFAEGESPWTKFVRCMTDGQIGSFLGETGDGVAWDDPAIDVDSMNEMMDELWTDTTGLTQHQPHPILNTSATNPMDYDTETLWHEINDMPGEIFDIIGEEEEDGFSVLNFQEALKGDNDF